MRQFRRPVAKRSACAKHALQDRSRVTEGLSFLGNRRITSEIICSDYDIQTPTLPLGFGWELCEPLGK